MLRSELARVSKHVRAGAARRRGSEGWRAPPRSRYSRAVPADAATLTIDLDALAHNHAVLRRLAGAAEVAPAVKADGYGLGASDVARRLQAEGARTFYVARLAEGVALRAVLPDATIAVLDGCTEGTARAIRSARLTPVLSSIDQVAAWSGAGGGAAVLHVDTGMNRLGVSVEEAQALAASPDRLRGVDLTTVMSHLACAEVPEAPLNAAQRARFEAAAAVFPGVRRSLCNSAGVLLGEAYAFEQVRPGVALYGGGPRGVEDARFRAVASFHAPVLQVRTVRRGETVGYDAAYTAPETMRVAIVAAGYADGVLRAAAGGLYGWADGRRLPVLGRISMDLTALDARDASDLRAGDPVELLGPNVPVDAVARAGGTIAYEVLCRLGRRGERRIVGAWG